MLFVACLLLLRDSSQKRALQREANEQIPALVDRDVETQLPKEVRKIVTTLTETRVNGAIASTLRNMDRTFLQCFVSIKQTNFLESAAFGKSVDRGGGGAMLGISCTMVLETCEIKSCASLIGGGVAGIRCDMDIRNSNFDGCKSYFMSGAVYCGVTEEFGGVPGLAANGVLNVHGCNFVGNKAKECHGALTASNLNDVCIEATKFENNYATTCGGAIGIGTSPTVIMDCLFRGNVIGGRMKVDQNLNSFHALNDPRSTNFQQGRMIGLPRGGGAIVFIWESAPRTVKFPDFATQRCCFVGNRCLGNAMGASELSTPFQGFDVAIGGYMIYQTFGDRFWNERDNSIQVVSAFDMGESTRIHTWSTRFYDTIVSKFFDNAPCSNYAFSSEEKAAPPSVVQRGVDKGVLTGDNIQGPTADWVDISQPPASTYDWVVTPRASDLSRTKRVTEDIRGVMSITHCADCTAWTGTKSNPFTASSLFSRSLDFSKSDAFVLTKSFTESVSFTASTTFTVTGCFTESSNFKQSQQFTQSSALPKSNVFSASSAYSMTNSFTVSVEFIATKQFSHSGVFKDSGLFSSSNTLSVSNVFRGTHEFVASHSFTISGTFVPSSEFRASGIFTASNKFTVSRVFAETGKFMETHVFAASKVMSPSNAFGASDHFSQSAQFVKSDLFSKSGSFTESGVFDASQVFSPSNSLSLSAHFKDSDMFSLSSVFTQTGAFSVSSSFIQTDEFTISNTMTQSAKFAASADLTNSAPLSMSSSFTGTVGFTVTDGFTETGAFLQSGGFFASDAFTHSLLSMSSSFTMSVKFVESSSFTKSISFTPSTSFSISEVFTLSKQFTVSGTFNPTGTFTGSGTYSESNAFTKTASMTETESFTVTIDFTITSAFTLTLPFTWTGLFLQTDPLPVRPPPTQISLLEKAKQETGLTAAAAAGVITALVALVIVGGVIVACFMTRKKQYSGSTSMLGESMETTHTTGVTNTINNPLWTLRIHDNTSDPFEDDFEEDLDVENVLGGGY